MLEELKTFGVSLDEFKYDIVVFKSSGDEKFITMIFIDRFTGTEIINRIPLEVAKAISTSLDKIL